MHEEWRDVVGAEDRYEVSSFGRIRAKAKILNPWITNGYEYVSLGRGIKKPVHRIVCEAFHGDQPGPNMVVAHADGSRNNNKIENLRWATYAENLQDSIKHGTCRLPQYADIRKGERHGMARLSKEQVEDIKSKCAGGMSRIAVAEEYGISRNHLWRILRGISWK